MLKRALMPQDVARYIRFDGGDTDGDALRWAGKRRLAGMPEKQTEGVAYLWNLLGKRRVAILADEVGMGKTYQALGLMCLLWTFRPRARILVMTPNRDICTHWELEYDTFRKHHWSPPPSGRDGSMPVHGFPEVERCANLDDLRRRIVEPSEEDPLDKSGRFYLTTIHSLSTLAPRDDGGESTLKAVGSRARAIRKAIQNHLHEGFDLIIVDEAHYLRHAHGDSQRAHAAREFFGPFDAQLGKHVLLMTATPSHSGLQDVPNILGYFTDTGELAPPALLERYALRRLRRMKGKGDALFHKHHYRDEMVLPASFDGQPESELFFALYQRQLVKELQQSKSGRRLFYGYLEGFESAGFESENAGARAAPAESANADEEGGSKSAFHEAPDTQLLRRLSQGFFKATDRYPDHPKYDALVADLVNERLFDADAAGELHDDKHLVFVRRIPSVREMTKRVNQAYDDVFARRILKAWGVAVDGPEARRLRSARWSRRAFENFVRERSEDLAEDDGNPRGRSAAPAEPGGEETEPGVDDALLGSRIMNLFVTKKDDPRDANAQDAGVRQPHSTDCSKVRLRFRKPESLFSLFLEPARDYRDAGYTHYYKGVDKAGKKDDYANAARDVRRRRAGREPDLVPYRRELEMGTAWALMYGRLSAAERKKLAGWAQRDDKILENFANYLKAGFLFASPVMIELYCWFTEFRQRSENRRNATANAQTRYLKFLRFADRRIDGSLMLRYFKDALHSFDRLCEKLVKQRLASEDEDWAKLASQHSPAWFASGESSHRDRLILGFNSPFFPNVLVATSVFQEGVNLHLHCRQVHHYGIAWTPGANEQRVGRLDRLFGRVNMELEKHGRAQLRIQYPYLADSFDQDQLASFLQKKHAVENEMDNCLQTNFDKAIDIAGVAADWRQYLKKPTDRQVDDPYEPKF
jgi:hypothetical protein